MTLHASGGLAPSWAHDPVQAMQGAMPLQQTRKSECACDAGHLMYASHDASKQQRLCMMMPQLLRD